MKVKDLIRELENYPQDMEVAIEQPAHDHWGNTRTTRLNTVNQEECLYSEYHRSYILSNTIKSDSKVKDYIVLG